MPYLEKLRYSDRAKKGDIFSSFLIVSWNELVVCRQSLRLPLSIQQLEK